MNNLGCSCGSPTGFVNRYLCKVLEETIAHLDPEP